MQKYKFGKNSRDRLHGVREELILLANRVIAKSENDFGIPRDGGIRTIEDQQRLFNTLIDGKRVTKCDGIKKLSKHQSGEAIDIFLYHSHKKGGRKFACWKCLDKYEEIAELFKNEFNLMKGEGLFLENEFLEWGGEWKWKDFPHFQISRKKKIEE